MSRFSTHRMAGVVAILALAFCGSAHAQGATSAVAYKPPSPEPQAFRDCPDCPEMVVVPAGRFAMGTSPQERLYEGVPKAFADREVINIPVTIAKPFAVGKFEITRGQYAKFVADTKRPDPATCAVYDPKAQSFSRETPGYSWRNPGFEQSDDHPAACISWTDARDYAAWLRAKTGKPYRLASEAEWEYAARGGTTTARYWGEGAESLCEMANTMTAATLEKLGWPTGYARRSVCAARHAFTQPVGSYPPNPFGLYDVIGNIFEWVQDCYAPTHAGNAGDGSAREAASCPQRMVKGGSFHSAPWLARAGFHGGPVVPGNHPVASGIRVVRDMG